MRIQVFPSGPFATNAYVTSCDETNKALILDPAPDSAEKILSYLESHSLVPIAILLTHSHWDHTADVAKLNEQLHLPILIHEADSPNLEQPGADGLPVPFPIEGVKPTSFLKEGDVVSVGNLAFEVIHTPGHSPGGICLHEKEQGVLFSGDTLFQGSIGNTSFPTSDEESMWISLKKLERLPSATKVYPGHGPDTTIQQEHWLPNAKQIFGG